MSKGDSKSSEVKQIESKIAVYAQKLESKEGGEEISKRVKKRVLQKLGALKKELIEASAKEVCNTTIGKKRKAEIIDATPEVSLPRKDAKMKGIMLNKELSNCALKKQLSLAIKKFENGVQRGFFIDIHTYSNLLNTYVRCGESEGAIEFWRKLIDSNIKPNLIFFTILIKGFSEVGDVRQMNMIYFEELKKHNLHPNTRTLNTFLRGCMRTGCVRSAIHAFLSLLCHTSEDTKSIKQTEIPTPDTSSYEYLTGLLCRSGFLDLALKLVSDQVVGVDQGVDTVGEGDADERRLDAILRNAAIYLNLAKAFSIRGQLIEAKEWMGLTSSTIQSNQQTGLREKMRKRFEQGGQVEMSSEETKGLSKSVALFLKHRCEEIDHELQTLQDFIAMLESSHQASVKRVRKVVEGGKKGKKVFLSGSLISLSSETVDNQNNIIPSLEQFNFIRSVQCHSVYLHYLSRVFYFGFDGKCDFDETISPSLRSLELTDFTQLYQIINTLNINSRVEGFNGKESGEDRDLDFIAGRLVISLRDKFGFTGCNKKLEKSFRKIISEELKYATARILESIDESTGFLNFPKIFKFSSYTNNSKNAENSNNSLNKSDKGANLMEYNSEDELPEWARVSTSTPKEPTLTSKSPKTITEQSNKPLVHLEIGAGSGEWVSAQAAVSRSQFSDENKPNVYWVALELRCDRVHNILCQNIFTENRLSTFLANEQYQEESDGLFPSLENTKIPSNFAIVGGDASKILPKRFSPSSVDAVFINYPQPPDGINTKNSKKGTNEKKQEGSHLLTLDFFNQLHRVLKDDGTITLLSDNMGYLQSIAQELATQTRSFLLDSRNDLSKNKSKGYISVPLSQNSPVRSVEEVFAVELQGKKREIVLWRGEPGEEAGHLAESSSYFDRMWEKGQKKRRWFLFLKKV